MRPHNHATRLLLILIPIILVSTIASLTPTRSADFWWHLKVGQIIAASGIPQTNMFAWTIPASQHYIYQSWLSEWLFFQIYSIGGLPLIVISRNLMIFLTFGLVALNSYRRHASLTKSALLLVILLLMSSNNLLTRPQNWSWIPYTLFTVILFEVTRKELPIHSLWACPLIMLFWVNTHGSFVLGLLLLFSYAAGESLDALLRTKRAISLPKLVNIFLILIITLATTALNPIGLGIAGYVYNLATNAPIRQIIYEWQPTRINTLAGGTFYAVLTYSVVLIVRRWGQLRISEIITMLGLGVMGIQSLRSIIWFGIAVLPMIISSPTLVDSPRTDQPHHSKKRGSHSKTVITQGKQKRSTHTLLQPYYSWGCFTIAVAVYLAVQPGIYPILPLPELIRAQRVDLPGASQIVSRSTPVAAVEHLREYPCKGHLFNESGAGSYVIWALGPQTQVFIDPRIELFPYELWDDYLTIGQGRNLAQLLDRKYQISCVLLDRELQPGLADVLSRSPGWVKTFPSDNGTENTPYEMWRRR